MTYDSATPLTTDRCHLRARLDQALERINVPSFADADPIQFPRSFTDSRDVEISALLCSTIAWGNRKMIVRNCQRMLEIMDNAPYDYVRSKSYEDLDDAINIHRTFFGRNLKYYLRGLQALYTRYGSLEAFVTASKADCSETPAWSLAESLASLLAEANYGLRDTRCISVSVATPLKRLNMALRWLVRDDGIVDIGLWKVLKPSQLYIPLDVHVADVSRALGLLQRRSNDRRAVLDLTAELRCWRPDDPVAYDFALFGIGMEQSMDLR
ncbi:MAG: TIGR02757 family protein [Bacteroidales bacterium]|jgi:uncharacterized protein (TIGR02757 family)|nr:TIGR02757 family protein [Bacteroidales bacterium]